MTSNEKLRGIVADLIEAQHQLARELETFVEKVEQSTGHLGSGPKFGIVASELAALKIRVNDLVPKSAKTKATTAAG